MEFQYPAGGPRVKRAAAEMRYARGSMRPPVPPPSWLALPIGVALLGSAGAASAHTTGQAFVLLLPTHLYIIGGAVVVAVSFLLVTLVPSRVFARLAGVGWRLRAPAPPPAVAAASTVASLLALAAAVVLIVAGVRGSRDPLANPLPLFVWTVWWIGFTYLHALFGNLWAHVNPWSGLARLARGLGWPAEPPLRYPVRAGAWPAAAGFLGFAWLELVHPAPADPALLARLVAGYLLVTLAGVALFGERAWLRHAEPFSVFFRVIAWLAPLGPGAAPAPADERRPALGVTLPGLRLLAVEPPGPSGVAFVLLVLASVSFDGFSRTFTWVSFLGENPLEYPGRSALVLANTVGLLGTFAVLGSAWLGVARLTRALAGSGGPGSDRALVLAIVPIAVGYHIAHYLPSFLVDVQRALRAASDPFALGWDLFGTRDLPVVASLLTDPARVYAIWHAQVGIIVAAHVAAVAVGHTLALRRAAGARALASQVPLLLLMIAYTLLGLWLLSTPAAA